MPIPYFDPLSLRDIAGFFNAPATNNVVFKNYYRGGPLVPDVTGNGSVPVSGPLAVKDFYATGQGRTGIFLVITADTYNFDVYAQRTSAYIAGNSDIYVIVQSGVYIGSNAQFTPAMAVPNTFSAGDTVSIVNNGFIYGVGGNGGGGFSLPGQPGNQGGTGLLVQRPTTVANYGELSGGGGGGGGGAIYIPNKGPAGPGGGGGGGAGLIGGSGGTGNGTGGSGTLNTAGAGVPGTNENFGAPGGARGVAGSTGGSISGANPGAGGSGGVAGYSVLGNALINWTATGTRTGPVG